MNASDAKCSRRSHFLHVNMLFWSNNNRNKHSAQERGNKSYVCDKITSFRLDFLCRKIHKTNKNLQQMVLNLLEDGISFKPFKIPIAGAAGCQTDDIPRRIENK